MTFRMTLLASTSTLIIGGAAFAADLPSKTGLAPFVTPAFTWSGVYGGVHGGFASLKPRYLENGTSANPSVTGASIGGLAGYNVQSGALVWGVEGDFGFGAHSKLGDNDYSKFTMPWNAHVRARLGYSIGQTMFFVAGGAAFAQFKVDDIRAGFGNFSQTRTGWTVGVGVEHALTANWIVRGEYLFDRYASKTSRIAFDAGKGSPYDARIKPDVHTVRAALLYKF